MPPMRFVLSVLLPCPIPLFARRLQPLCLGRLHARPRPPPAWLPRASRPPAHSLCVLPFPPRSEALPYWDLTLDNPGAKYHGTPNTMFSPKFAGREDGNTSANNAVTTGERRAPGGCCVQDSRPPGAPCRGRPASRRDTSVWPPCACPQACLRGARCRASSRSSGSSTRRWAARPPFQAHACRLGAALHPHLCARQSAGRRRPNGDE